LGRWFARAFLLASVLACGTDAVLLPDDFNKRKVKVISIDYQSNEGTLVNLSGLQGGPAALIPGDASLLKRFQDAQVNIVRVPQGYLCPYSLSGIFPDAAADPFDPASYNFEFLDKVIKDAALVGARVVFQAHADLGSEACKVDAKGSMLGQPIQDADKWAAVVANLVRHYNKNILDENRPGDQPWHSGAFNYNLSHIEFIDDPMGRGGYTDASLLANHFGVLAEILKDEEVFPKYVTGQSYVTLIAPSMLIESAADVASHSMWDFVGALEAAGKLGLLDVLSYKTQVSTPSENYAIAVAIRAQMTALGLTQKLWNVGYRSSLAANPKPSGSQGTVEYWSSFEGAFATATKILWQGLVDGAIYDRGDRRYLTLEQDDLTQVEQSPLWSSKADYRPAGVAWLPWLFMATAANVEDSDKVRLKVSSPADIDTPGLAVTAVKCVGKAPFGNAPAPCKDTLFLLIANSNTQLLQAQVSYQITITGIDQGAVPSRSVLVQRSQINQSTEALSI
jgi:hypothetical protein